MAEETVKKVAAETAKAGVTAAATLGCPLMGVGVGAALYAPEQAQEAVKEAVKGALPASGSTQA